MLEELALDAVVARLRARAHAALRVDYALPRNAVLGVEGVQRVAHLARLASQARELGHLAVGRDAAARDASHHGVDTPVGIAARGRRRGHPVIVADLEGSGILGASPVATITLYGSARTPFTEKVRRALLYKRLPFELCEPTCAEDYRRWNPKSGMLPVLTLEEDGVEQSVEDSTDILYALDARFPEPPLLSADPTTASQQRQLENWADESFLWYFLKYRRMVGAGEMELPLASDAPEPDATPATGENGQSGALRRFAAWLRAGGTWERPITGLLREIGLRLDDLVNFLGARPYFYSDRLSVADLGVYAMLYTLRNGSIPGAEHLLAQRPSLVAFMERVEQATAPPPAPPAPPERAHA